jgi:hypothetical protein
VRARGAAGPGRRIRGAAARDRRERGNGRTGGIGTDRSVKSWFRKRGAARDAARIMRGARFCRRAGRRGAGIVNAAG